MTQFENDRLAALLSDMETTLPALAPDEFNELYRLTLSHAGITPRRTRNSLKRANRRAWLIAAALAALVLMAAGYYSVSDAFKGVLKEQQPTSARDALGAQQQAVTSNKPIELETKPLDKTAPIVEKAGVLPMESTTADGITVTLRAAVFDEMNSKLIVDVAKIDGSSLHPKNDRILRSYGLHFKDAELFVDGQERGFGLSCNLLDMEDDGSDGKISFLLDGNGLPAEARGKNARLVLSKLIDQVEFKIQTDLATTKGELDLYTLYQKLEPADMSEFYKHEMTNRKGESTGNDYQRIDPSTREGIVFSTFGPEVRLDTMIIEKGKLFMFGVAPDQKTAQRLHGLKLKSLQTGEFLLVGGGGRIAGKEGDQIDWALEFNDIGDLEALKSLTLASPASGKSALRLEANSTAAPDDGLVSDSEMHAADGPWELKFPLDYEAVDRVVTPPAEAQVVLRKHQYLVKEVRLSPFSIELKLMASGVVDPNWGETRGWLDGEFQKLTGMIYFKDGTALPVTMHGAADSSKEGTIRLWITPEVVLDPEAVQAIVIGERTITLP